MGGMYVRGEGEGEEDFERGKCAIYRTTMSVIFQFALGALYSTLLNARTISLSLSLQASNASQHISVMLVLDAWTHDKRRKSDH